MEEMFKIMYTTLIFNKIKRFYSIKIIIFANLNITPIARFQKTFTDVTTVKTFQKFKNFPKIINYSTTSLLL